MDATTPETDLDTLEQQNQALREELRSVKNQLQWFQRQLFGQKSEKYRYLDNPLQGNLLEGLVDTPATTENTDFEITTCQRRQKKRGDGCVTDSGLRFDKSVPVKTIELPNPELDGVNPDELEQIGEKITYRLAQRPGSYVVIKYIRKVLKRKKTQTIFTPPAPDNVLDKSIADVSFLAGMLVDKFVYHLPLHRQHLRINQSGLELARSTLTNLTKRAIDLLSPIADAQWHNILLSRVLAMDETPIKAGLKQAGKMRQAYFWPVYGEADEVAFSYSPTRAGSHVKTMLGEHFSGTLVSDGYAAYARYAKNNQLVTHAECWAHTRRYFERAESAQPQAAAEILTLIGKLYDYEKKIRHKKLDNRKKQAYRTEHSEPMVKEIWRWCDEQCHRVDLLPSDPLSKALKYAMARQSELQVFLADPDVPIDTNHLERALRPIPMGRRNWLFCWTEVGAKQVAIIQSLLVTCKLHGINPHTYLVDVLQRISQHPANRVEELTPRLWKEKFADNPLRSDLDHLSQ